MDPWWYNIVTGKVEHGPGAPHAERLGPFDTEEEAENALELVKERNEKWAADDRRWNGESDGPPPASKSPKSPKLY